MNAQQVAERSAVYALQDSVAPVGGEAFDLLTTAPQGVAKLRELILSLAVRGKLVSQIAQEGSAATLLEQIEKQHMRLVARGEAKHGKPAMPTTLDELPFEIPGTWAWTRIGTIGSVIGGGTPDSHDPTLWATGSEIPWLTPADLYGFREKYVSHGRRDITAAGLAGSSAQLLPTGTVLFSSRAPIGYVAIAANPLATNQGFKSCALFVPELADYLYWFLKQAGNAIDAAASGTTFKEISGSKFAAVLVPLPPLAEQHRIVARVEELMGLCYELETRGRLQDEQHARLVATLFDALVASASPAELADNWQRIARHFDLLLDRPEAVDALEQTILQLAVRGLLVPQDPADEPFVERIDDAHATAGHASVRRTLKHDGTREPRTGETHVPPTPSAWKWLPIDVFCEVQGGIQKTPLRRPVKHHFPYLRVANVQRGALNLGEVARYELTDDELERWRLRTGDLLVVEGNGSEDEIGRCAIWDGSIDPCVFQNHLIRVRPHVAAAVRFVALVLNSPDGIAEMRRLAITTSGLFNLSVGKIRKIAIPMPPRAEQQRILARVDELRGLCADLRQRLQQAQATQSNLADALVATATHDRTPASA
jgi:type I restriction enzyme S subunit